VRMVTLRGQVPGVSTEHFCHRGEYDALDHHSLMPAISLMEFAQALYRVTINANGHGLLMDTPPGNPEGAGPKRHPHDVNSKRCEFLWPLCFEVGNGGSDDVGELITRVHS